MNSKYKVSKYHSGRFENIDDLVSIEEPLEISIKFKEKNDWVTRILSITMRTPGDDEDLVRGFLFNEQLIKDIKSSKISFTEAAAKHSACASGPRHGGELGWFNEEKMHPDFSEAVKVIPVDDIGPPVITPWGVHIVYRQG